MSKTFDSNEERTSYAANAHLDMLLCSGFSWFMRKSSGTSLVGPPRQPAFHPFRFCFFFFAQNFWLRCLTRVKSDKKYIYGFREHFFSTEHRAEFEQRMVVSNLPTRQLPIQVRTWCIASVPPSQCATNTPELGRAKKIRKVRFFFTISLYHVFEGPKSPPPQSEV